MRIAVQITFQPVLQDWHVEVDQQCLLCARQPHVGENLCLVNWQQTFDGLQLDDQPVFANQIDSKSDREIGALVFQGQRHLPFEAHSGEVEFLAHAAFVDTLEKAGAKGTMNSNGAADDDVCEWVAFDGHA